MSRLWALFTLAGLSLSCAAPVMAGSVSPPAAVTEADAVELDLEAERTYASGNAHLSYADLDLHADSVVAERVTGDVQASGNLRITQGARHLSGQSITYNLHTKEGSLASATAVEQGVIITGEEIVVSPDRMVARRARFTTCDKPEPHLYFGARTITLTAPRVDGRQPRSGTLSLDDARLCYRNRTIFRVPFYSVKVGGPDKRPSSPLPGTGFSRDDGPYASFGYTLGRPGSPVAGDLSYRYTTFRGVRGHLKVRGSVGPAEISIGYIRREDSADRVVEPDDLEANLADVLVNRQPEYGISLPTYRLSRLVSVQADLVTGRYSERTSDGDVERVGADRTSLSILLRSDTYRISRSVELSHAVGWRHSRYSPGDDLRVQLLRHSAQVDLGPRVQLNLSYVTRRQSGETPFLFDGIGPRRELTGNLTWTVNPAWRLRFVESYDLEKNDTRDMIIEATRTAHCLEYTIGWRRKRGMFYVGLGLAPPVRGR